MAWRPPTEADLLQRMSGDELDTLRAASLGSDQGDPIQGHLIQLTNFVRGYIRANPRNRLGPEGSLPEALILPAMDYLVVNVSSRIAGLLIDLNDTRVKAYDAANTLFRDVARNAFAVEPPDTVSPEKPSGASVEQASGSRVDVTRESMGGL